MQGGSKTLPPLQTAGGMQEVRVLSEADVLRLIVSSNLPAAKRFERWVFEEWYRPGKVHLTMSA
ncbi:BRO-N domain-containing protein [Methyloparacoccus murrellii]